jgi:predicted acyl esterase
VLGRVSVTAGGKMENQWRKLISQPQYAIKAEKDIFVPVRDGVRLALDLFRPDAPGKFPALLAMSAYGKELQALMLPPQPLNKSAVWDGNIEAGDTSEYVSRGYVHVIGDVRGSGQSEGEYLGSYTTQEGIDGYDLIEWIAQQPWCNGNVGMLGYSYYSKVQLKVAIQQPPHLKAIFTSHIEVDNYRDTAYHGGVLSLFPYGIWDGRHGTSGYAPKNALSLVKKTLSAEEFERRRRERLQDPDIRHYPNLFHLLNYPYKNPRFFDMLMNPCDGPFYWDKSVYPFYDKIQVPIYIIGKAGHEAGAYWKLYQGVSAPKKLYAKPHGAEERPWREDIELIVRWYDHWLKDNDTGIMDEPPIKMFVPGANQYRHEWQWPLPGLEYVNCYLRRWEGLSFAPEAYQPEPDCYLQQPLHLATKRDSVIYVSPPLNANLEVIGPAALNFFAAIDQDDTHWIIKLFDVAPTGAQRRLGKGFLKASHRAIDPQRSTPNEPWHPHTNPAPVKPGEIEEYNIGLGVITNMFKAGHRIKVEIESLESPRDPEMQIHYHPHLNCSKTVLHKVFRNKQYPSHLVLPVVSGRRDVWETMCDENFQGGV